MVLPLQSIFALSVTMKMLLMEQSARFKCPSNVIFVLMVMGMLVQLISCTDVKGVSAHTKKGKDETSRNSAYDVILIFVAAFVCNCEIFGFEYFFFIFG